MPWACWRGQLGGSGKRFVQVFEENQWGACVRGGCFPWELWLLSS